LGFLRAAQDEKRKNNDAVAIIEFQPEFGNEIKTISPILGTRDDWKRIFQTALEDLTGLIAPKMIIYCEGKMTNSLDEEIFNAIFADQDHCLFVSATNKSESVKYAGVALTILNKAFDEVEIRVLVDRDEDTGSTPKISKVKICKLERLEFENYLFNFEIISKAFPSVTEVQWKAIVADQINDDIKSKMQDIKNLLCDQNDQSLKIKLARNISKDTQTYKDLHKIIFE
jgi:hypothetical protein